MTRKTWITTQANGTHGAAWTTEVYDTFGRLASVCENQNRDWNGSCSGFLETRYSYDEQDNLTKVYERSRFLYSLSPKKST